MLIEAYSKFYQWQLLLRLKSDVNGYRGYDKC